ncbi:hypothetical protein JAAARDRAFT_54644 [Jaapia argillacea MUCL 33604]|uniref:YTH domain-containing protein n=1 Tax=Jaapia argillacea MUCL 33604 TaxID=933084 RepID=A0A067QJF3_9AGAM|nr:hypothetical protein JAAARDRAFT_54644 [Jaapia argillacea MUCL 33604]
MPVESGKGDDQDLSSAAQSSSSDAGRPSGSSRQRPNSQATSARRPPPRQPYLAPPGPPFLRPSPSETLQSPPTGPSRFHPPPTQFQQPRPSSFTPQGGYGGPYALSPPAPGALAHSPPYAYNHGYPHPGSYVHDTTMISPNHHISYPSGSLPSIIPHHSSPGPSGVYGHHITPSPPSRSPLSSPSAPSGPYPNQSQYYSPMSTPPFSYAQQSFTASAQMYQAPYTPSPFHQSYVHSPEQETPGWWYMHPSGAMTPSQFEHVQSPYIGQYGLGYPSFTRPDVDSFGRPTPTGPSPIYPSLGRRPQLPSAQPVVAPPAPASAPPSYVPPDSPHPTTISEPSGHSGPSNRSSAERAVARRPHHPNPPVQRSEWVMWVGNVPSDATYEELWRVFNERRAIPSGNDPPFPEGIHPQEHLFGGVSSMYLIGRSNCAFVNFDSEDHLHSAIARFNGQPLRIHDPKCPRLVCRVRGKEDDLKAGVGAQRGTGLHVKWIKDSKGKMKEAAVGLGSSKPGADEPATSESDNAPTSSSASSSLDTHARRFASMSLSSDEEGPNRKPQPKNSSSGSYASTNSSILSRHFPKRYFILKSLTQFDLDLSVEKGLWATQKHNEAILDQAFRTSQDVYLIFGVNKSGEFYGYARMAGPILRGEQRVPWASRTDSSPSSQRGSRRSDPVQEDPDGISQTQRPPSYITGHVVDQSPLPVSPSGKQIRQQPQPPRSSSPNRDILSAPAEMDHRHRGMSTKTPPPKMSLDYQKLRPVAAILSAQGPPDDFELDHDAPIAAMRDHHRSGQGSSSSSRDVPTDSDGVKRVDMISKEERGASAPLQTVAEEEEQIFGAGAAVTPAADGTPNPVGGRDGTGTNAPPEGWGESFRVDWIRSTRLPFWRTRHLRNPWNHDREVKVSRDGTELEPGVGQMLLEEWDRPDPPQSPVGFKYPGRRAGGEPKAASTGTSSVFGKKQTGS